MVEVVKRANDQNKLFSDLTFFFFFPDDGGGGEESEGVGHSAQSQTRRRRARLARRKSTSFCFLRQLFKITNVRRKKSISNDRLVNYERS